MCSVNFISFMHVVLFIAYITAKLIWPIEQIRGISFKFFFFFLHAVPDTALIKPTWPFEQNLSLYVIISEHISCVIFIQLHLCVLK